jgi:6-phosphogluconolactonase
MSGSPRFIIVDDAKAVATAAADLVIDAARHAVEARGVFRWCATGGSTPAALYGVLREEVNVSRMPWSQTEIWFGDDRHVPRTSPLSNLASLDSVLLAKSADGTPAPTTPRKVHPWPTEEDGPRAVNLYLRAARSAGVEHTSAGVPIFDLVMIGIGSDAHCLSVFPGSPLTASDAPVAASIPAPTHIEPHVARLSFSLGLLSAARAVCATVVGAGKSAALARILEGPGGSTDLPAKAALLPTATWIVDRAAAAGLHAATER